MRHKKKGKILDRKVGPRRALLRGLSRNLALSERIITTEAKAKALRPIFERLVSRAKVNNLTNYRRLNSFLQSRQATKKMLEQIGPKYKERRGGYLRIIKMGMRKGDRAKMAIIELV